MNQLSELLPIAPFALLLLLIAIMPLSPASIKHWWEKYYPHVSLGLAGLIAAYYLLGKPLGAGALLHTGEDYVSFICLIGSLYVVAGGIHIRVKGGATPWDNVLFLAVGAVMANFIGTTGASMVLIRPWIRMNRVRISAYHIAFFIFVVSNVGGALTPIGDPPLFLGYLRGVPFFWLVEHVLVRWLFTVGAIIGVFYFIDRRSFHRMPADLQHRAEDQHDHWRLEGKRNLAFLLAIIGAVFLPDTYFIREIVMCGAGAASWYFTPKQLHEQNAFNFGPIKEVALLFVGIFVTMLPALDYLRAHGSEFGITNPMHYYLASGALSSVLDNAPTYVNFLELAQTTAQAQAPQAFAAAHLTPDGGTLALIGHQPLFVVAVSMGAVFFGAMTYIGNGPNFMVKAIAHEAGVHTPSFFGYIFKYSLPVLLPILTFSGWLALH